MEFKYASKVQEIIYEKGEVKGVQVAGVAIHSSLVISNMDIWFTYNKLLPKLRTAKTTINQERSSSALIFYWGISKTFPELDIHNIFFSADYEGEFESIWTKKCISDDPTIYLNISSKYKTDDAPAGCENWFVMINVPANIGQDWDKMIADAKICILAKLQRMLGRPVEDLIVCETILDPRSIEMNSSSYQGSLYGTSSNNQFAAFLRHPNFSSIIKGLYFVGGSVHPGGGIPLALLSAKITTDLISESYIHSGT